jgi:phosphoglycolate phosphatase-like HAD superfamily hydrolase
MEKERGWVFFDIDGTLLYARGVGREAFRQAFDEALGWDQGVEHVNFYGATDLDVFRTLCAERGEESTPKMERAFFDRLAPALDQGLARTPPELFPNVERVLQELSGKWSLGIVTGNIEETARSKLKHAGLLDYFDPDGFGCGCAHADRNEIARRVLKRVGSPERSALIGDTPKDIQAAHINGMTAIAVATGGFTAPELEQAGADFVFPDLEDMSKLLLILEGI